MGSKSYRFINGKKLAKNSKNKIYTATTKEASIKREIKLLMKKEWGNVVSLSNQI